MSLKDDVWGGRDIVGGVCRNRLSNLSSLVHCESLEVHINQRSAEHSGSGTRLQLVVACLVRELGRIVMAAAKVAASRTPGPSPPSSPQGPRNACPIALLEQTKTLLLL